MFTPLVVRARLRARSALLVVGLSLTIGAGCDRAASTDMTVTRKLPAFAIDERPTLVLEEDGTPEKQFAGISARRTPDGSIVVANRGTSEIHLFDRSGNVVRKLAQRGTGPGELRGGFQLTSRGDTVLVLGRPPDALGEVNTFSTQRGFIARTRLAGDGTGSIVAARDRLSTGEFLVEKGPWFRAFSAPPQRGILISDSVTFGVLQADSRVVWLPPVIRGWLFAFPTPGGPVPTSVAPYTLGSTTTAVVSDDRVWLIDAKDGRLLAFDRAGTRRVDQTLSVEPQKFDAAALGRRRARELAAAARAFDSARIRSLYDEAPLPETAPLVAGASAGQSGEVWVRLFELDDDAPRQFVVIDREGAEVARATLPSRVEVQQIGPDFVLAVRRDSLGVESVVEYTLRRK